MLKKQFFVYGIVQGVGFRYFTWREAVKIGVKGYVCNRQDGSVEVVAFGSEQQLKQLYHWLKQGPKTARVEYISEQDYITDSEFQDFSLRY
ncbi:acylphosphatase [Pasteurella canis]|uniref:acylphosphatase n=1 Tax=Pasteurella canis TaxID=753 RepID=UPI000668BDBA|nr:acylphosphatase [Pasteurella canis]UEA17215.1 acylphosphatase [Pasteurella canis]SPY33418.1 acylphosphatase [Pasteurella canis]